MYNEEEMNKALRAYDWPTVLKLLPERTLEAVRELLSDVSRSGCLIRVFRLSPELEEQRTQMIEQLKAFGTNFGGEDAVRYIEYLLNQVSITELTLAEIESSFDKDEYAALTPAEQAWSALMWAAGEMHDVHRQIHATLEDYREGESIVIDPLHLRLDKEHGHGLAVGRIYQLSQTVANTLRMLGHWNKWTSSGRFAIPARVTPRPQSLSAAERISRLGDVWEDVVDESKFHRYWGGYFEVREPDGEQKEVLPNLDHVVVSVTTERERRDDCQISEYIARNRMQRIQVSVSQRIARSSAKDKIKSPRMEAVPFPPAMYVSEVEMVSVYMLEYVLHFNPLKNAAKFGGLTILGWLRGYCVLEACYAKALLDMSEGVIEIDQQELVATLERASLSSSEAKTFVERLTFQAGRRDLYDAPLLRTQDNRLFFLASLYRGIDVSVIVASQIGTQRLNVDEKGKTFEKAVLSGFKDAGIEARAFKFVIGAKQYECDVAVLWDHHLFVFECKNYGLPSADPADRLFFWNKQVSALKQVERIAQDLTSHPEIIREQFGEDAVWDQVHAVVLNASFLSLERTPSGAYFYDASALARFLENGALNEIHSVPADGQRVEVSVEVKRLWRGAKPTPDDLLQEMSFPTQVKMERDKYYIARRLMPLSETSAVMIMTAASQPPDFEPLINPEKGEAAG